MCFSLVLVRKGGMRRCVHFRICVVKKAASGATCLLSNIGSFTVLRSSGLKYFFVNETLLKMWLSKGARISYKLLSFFKDFLLCVL